MKNITLNITEVQYHYLKGLAEQEVRSIEQLLYILLHKGLELHYCDSDLSLEVLPRDQNYEEREAAADPERIIPIHRSAYEIDAVFADLLNFKLSAIDPDRAKQRDGERDLAAELIEQAEYHELLEKRMEEVSSKSQREWREFKQQQETNEESND